MLKVLLPKIEPKEYFDDCLADTLDALFDFGIGDLEMLITQNMIRVFILYVADSKLISHESMAHIHDNGGFFVAPAPMYKSYKKTIIYQAPFDRCDREKDYETAWGKFEKRL